MSFEQRVTAVSKSLKSSTPAGFAAKVKASSGKISLKKIFNNWHANKDNNIGTDTPWGSNK